MASISWDDIEKKDQNWCLPDGEYLVEINNVTVKASTRSPWVYWEFKFVVVSPDKYKNRMFFHKYFVDFTGDPVPESLKKSKTALSRLSIAAIKGYAQEPEELIGAQLYVKLKEEPGRPKNEKDGGGFWPPSNFICDVKPADSYDDQKELPPMTSKQASKPSKSYPQDMQDDEVPF